MIIGLLIKLSIVYCLYVYAPMLALVYALLYLEEAVKSYKAVKVRRSLLKNLSSMGFESAGNGVYVNKGASEGFEQGSDGSDDSEGTLLIGS